MAHEPRLSVFYDDVFLTHEAPDGTFEYPADDHLAVTEPHPDRPARLRNVKRTIETALADYSTWESVTPATRDQLEAVHDPDYLDEFEAFCARGGGRVTLSTAANEATYEAARHAAGATVQAAMRALETDGSEVPYALVRPSGHHAQPAQWDGYCFINNAAVAAEHALATGAVERVAIVDWDVHPGNGTQEVFYDRDDVLFVSLHNDFGAWDPETHPQTGGLEEVGVGDGEGYTVNVPLPPGTGDAGYGYAFERLVEPVVAAFDPDLLLVSAGQDGGIIDPSARNMLTKDGFHDLGERMRRLADAHADGSLVVVQEGGYQISHLAFATLGVLEGVLGVETDVEDPFAALDEYLPPARTWVDEAVAAYADYWPLS